MTTDDVPDFEPVDDLADEEPEIRIRPCARCGGEGCSTCDDTGVIYP